MWSAVGKAIAGALLGKGTTDVTERVLDLVRDAEDAQLTALHGLHSKVDVLLDAPFKAARDELVAAERSWRAPNERVKLIESARVLFVQARAVAPDPARAAACDWYLALCWLALGHPEDARTALERGLATVPQAIRDARQAWMYAPRRAKPGTFTGMWRQWRDRVWPKDEEEVARLQAEAAAVMNAACDLSRGAAEVAAALGATRGLARYWITRDAILHDWLTIVAGHRTGEVVAVDGLELTVARPRELPHGPWSAAEIAIHNPSREPARFSASFQLAWEPWRPRDDWPVFRPPAPFGVLHPDRVREVGATPIMEQASDGLWVRPGATRRGDLLVPKERVTRAIVLPTRSFDAAVVMLD